MKDFHSLSLEIESTCIVGYVCNWFKTVLDLHFLILLDKCNQMSSM